MSICREYGTPPFTVAVVHGGPGAVGEMEPVARALAPDFGVLEPIQTAETLDGQVAELQALVAAHTEAPVSLVGFSWGAWLSYITAVRHPALVKKLILVGSGPYTAAYVKDIGQTRMSRLTEAEQAEYHAILRLLKDPEGEEKAERFARLGELADKSDRYDAEDVPYSRPDLGSAAGREFHEILTEVQAMRADGRLLAYADQIQCPTAALHGDYDPHPAAGVREPLSAKLRNFRFTLLEKCGHKPWIERRAAGEFYRLLKRELLV